MKFFKKYWYLIIIALITVGLGVVTVLTGQKLQQANPVAPNVPQATPRAAEPGCTVGFQLEAPAAACGEACTGGPTAWSTAINISVWPTGSSGAIQTADGYIIGSTLTQGVWRGNRGYSRTVPVVNGVPNFTQASAWSAPIEITALPGSGDIQTSSAYVIGDTLHQGIWRGDQGFARTVPIVNGVPAFSQAGAWSAPIAISVWPAGSSGALQTADSYIIGNTLTQAVWRGNKGYSRTVPIVNGTPDFNQATAWSAATEITVLPGSGDIQTSSAYIIGTTLHQGIWRGNEGFTRTVPIINGTVDWSGGGCSTTGNLRCIGSICRIPECTNGSCTCTPPGVITNTPTQTVTQTPSHTPTATTTTAITSTPTETPTNTPTVTPNPQCGGSCNNGESLSNHTCSAGTWVLSDCLVSGVTCTANRCTVLPTPTPEKVSCSNTCNVTSDCVTGLTCVGGMCRNPACTSETNCICQVSQITPTPVTPQVPVAGTGPTVIGLSIIAGGILLLLLGLAI